MHVWSVFVNGVGVLSSFPVIPVLLISLLRESSRTNLKQIKAVYLSRRLNFAATLVLLIEGLDEGRGQEIFEPRWRTRLYKVACQCHPFELEPADLTGVLLFHEITLFLVMDILFVFLEALLGIFGHCLVPFRNLAVLTYVLKG